MNIIKIVNAAESGLVTCSGGDCTVCGIIETVSKIYNFLTGLSFAVAVLFLALAGLVFIFGTGVRKSYFLKAKVFAKNAIIGFVFVLVGWLAIHAVLFSTGYKNAGNWWQFQCATETSTSFQSGSIKSFSPYANIADFIASGNSKGVIQGPVSEAAFQNQISQLKEGETLTFYLPAKDNSTGREIMVPFLAGYKSGGGMKMDAKTISLLIALIKGLSGSGGDLSLLSSAGSILSNPMALIGKLISFLFPSLGQIMGSLGSGGGLSGAALNNAIGALSGMAAKYQPDGTPVGALTAALTNEVVGTAKDALSSVAVEKGQQSSDSSKTASDGDRSADSNKWTISQQQTQQKDYSKPVSPANWQDSRGANDPPAPGGHSDDMDDVIKDRDGQKKPDELSPDDWAPGDGTAEAIKKALRRIYKRDYLRYEMMFRFVKHIGKKDSGGECTGCGDIYMMRDRAKILDIAHMLVHEGTHSGQFCLGLMDKYIAEGIGTQESPGPGRGKIEAIACANQIGSLKLGTNPDMREFPRGKENLCYKGWCKTRGDVARYYTEVGQPEGDLNDEIINSIFERFTQYPIENKYENRGPYQYGKTAEHLKLRDPEEDVVKAIMKQEGPINCEWGSCPTSDLPKLSVPCNCDEIKIEP